MPRAIAVVVFVIASIIGTAPLARADSTVTAFTGSVYGVQPIAAGDTFAIKGAVVDSAGDPVPDTADGNVRLDVRYSGSDTWWTLGTDANEGAWAFTGIQAVRNARYRLIYGGGSSAADTYGPATASASVAVRRLLGDDAFVKDRQTVLHGNITPGTGTVVVERRTCQGCTWHVWRRVDAGARGVWRTTLAAPALGKTWTYRCFMPYDGEFAKSPCAKTWAVSSH